jgi:hypothetical protein
MDQLNGKDAAAASLGTSYSNDKLLEWFLTTVGLLSRMGKSIVRSCGYISVEMHIAMIFLITTPGCYGVIQPEKIPRGENDVQISTSSGQHCNPAKIFLG